MNRRLAIGAALTFLCLFGAARAGEENISFEKLPKAVREAVKAKFPEAKVTGAAKEEEGGKVTFEVMLKSEGKTIDVALSPDGKILEVEKEVALQDIPSAARKVLADRYTNAKIKKVEAITKAGGQVSYEVLIETELTFNAKGKLQDGAKKEEKDEDDDDDKGHDKKKEVKKDGKQANKKAEKDDDDDDDKGHDKKKELKKGGK